MREPERFVIYARGHRPPDVHSRVYIPIFYDPAHAKTWLEFFLEGEETVRDGDKILLSSGIELKSEQLDRILNCRAAAVELPAIDERRILRFKLGSWDEQHDKPVRVKDDGVESAPRVERERRPERPTGYVTITELCAASGMLPMHARAALRASDRVKPPYGWAFDPKEVPAIKALCGMK